MAAPVDQSRVGTSISTAAGTWTINWPTGVVAGDVLIMHIRTPTGVLTSSDPPVGWTSIGSSTADASDDWDAINAKVADGSESGTASLGMASSTKGACTIHRVSGATQNMAEIQAFGSAPNSANADPPVFSVSLKDYLIILAIGLDGETQTFTQPATYSNLVTADSGTGGAATSNVRIAAAAKQATAFTGENPGAWTNAAPSSGVTLWTVAVPNPAAAVPRHGFVNFQDPGVFSVLRRPRIERPRIWVPRRPPLALA